MMSVPCPKRPVSPPAKKRRLSLSLKKGGGPGGPLAEISNQRFRSPVKEKEVSAAAKGVVPMKQCQVTKVLRPFVATKAHQEKVAGTIISGERLSIPPETIAPLKTIPTETIHSATVSTATFPPNAPSMPTLNNYLIQVTFWTGLCSSAC